MKSFLKYLLASILGIIIASVLVFLIFLGIVSAMLSKQEKPVDVKERTVLRLTLDQPIADRKQDIPVLTMGLDRIGIASQIGLNELLDNLEKARTDTNIAGIYLELSDIGAGIATVEEVRNALLSFKKSGKFILAYSDTYSQGAYYLATVADKLYLNPAGYINLVGLSAQVMFYKQALDKLDIEPEIIRHGQFKSAVEPYMYDRMSPENREQLSVYIGSIWDHVLDNISESRNVPVERLNDFADRLVMWNNNTAEEYGLVDGILYSDQVLDTLARLTDMDDASDLRMVSYDKYLRVPKSRSERGYVREKIAVVYASGTIYMGDQLEGNIGSVTLSRAIREAREDSSVKAIVLRINSGGGSAMASEVIWRELMLTRGVKPVIVSMGDMAASGGYYIAVPADHIVANPLTLTGSIGVFGLTFNAGNFLGDKIGITLDVENTNRYSDFGSVFRPLSPVERETMQQFVDLTYSTFVSHVSEGRQMAFEAVDAIGEGRIWSGLNALELNLVDTLGGLNTAVELAAAEAGLEAYRIKELPEIEDMLTRIMNEFSARVKESVMDREVLEISRHLKELGDVVGNDRIQTRVPFDVEVR